MTYKDSYEFFDTVFFNTYIQYPVKEKGEAVNSNKLSIMRLKASAI